MTESFTFIDRNTSFNGNIEAKQVIIEGEVNGDITASNKVLVKNEAVINGNIITERLLFEEGGQHNGMILLAPKAEDAEPELISSAPGKEPDKQQEDRSKKSLAKKI